MNLNTNKLLTVTSSPHIKSSVKTSNIMLEVILALLPMVAWAVYIFGLRSLTLTAISVISCVFFEFIYRLILKKSNDTGDFSAVVTGILLALTLPVSVPLWLPVMGAFFAIIIVKQLYGGIGKNIVNPALCARVFLFIAYPAELTTFTIPGEKLSPIAINVSKKAADIIASATPLVSLKNGTLSEYDTTSALIGNIPGCIGEISASLIMFGGIWLIYRRIITWHIPVSFLLTVAVISYIFPVGSYSSFEFMLYQLFSGGLMLGAFFMATDYVTSPITKKGRIIFGIGCGIITMFIRYFGGYSDGVSFAILIMNLLVWYIDNATKSKAFGGVK